MTSSPQPDSERPRFRGPWSAILYFVGVAVLVGAVYWIGGAAGSPPTDGIETISASTTTTAQQLAVESPSFVEGEEPIADAAAVILPSVVHIQTTSGVGSGVIYDSDGLIITAAHVVAGEETVRVRFDDGEQVTARVLGVVEEVDIALLEVDRSDLDAATFSAEKPRVGQLAIAVGSPWGLASTVTAGIISAVDQTNCGFDTCASMLQTDAAINPGNSGGALVNREGEVVGINVSIFTTSGASDGVGFAVPSAIAIEYAEAIITGEPIETAFLGVSVDDVVEGRAGALITEIIPGTAAEEAGLEVGDVVIEIDGVPVQGRLDLIAQVRAHRPGDAMEIVILREGTETTIEVTLGVRSEDLS